VRKGIWGVFARGSNIEFSLDPGRGPSCVCYSEQVCSLDGVHSSNIDGDMERRGLSTFGAMRRGEPFKTFNIVR
jgi:hypothetical protein